MGSKIYVFKFQMLYKEIIHLAPISQSPTSELFFQPSGPENENYLSQPHEIPFLCLDSRFF